MILSPMILRVWLLIIFTLTMRSTAFDSYHKIPKICTESQAESQCEGKVRGEKVTCRGGFYPQTTKENTKAKSMYICQWAERVFSPSNFFERFPKITKLTMREGNLTFLREDFPRTQLEMLSLTEQPLNYLQPTAFSNLTHLKTLDLSKNQFQDLDPAVIYYLPETTKVYLAGNPWNCTRNLFWMLDPIIQMRIADLEKIHCEHSYPGKSVVKVLKFLQKMEEGCPVYCNCSMTHLAWDIERTYLHPVIEVNCTHRGFTEMPKSLPTNTTTVFLGYNRISDISNLANSPTYAHVLDVYLDHNLIANVDILEGTEWLKQFRVLSLKNNFLTNIPVYALDHALEVNRNLGKVYLGENPWICNCEFTPAFQHFLIKYQTVVRDLQNIKCSKIPDSELSLMPILELRRGSVCREGEFYINPLDILSCILASLIFLVLGKLVYDYWTFKRTGKLPWIVTKMP